MGGKVLVCAVLPGRVHNIGEGGKSFSNCPLYLIPKVFFLIPKYFYI